jgi:hypothetical protein
VAVRSPQLAISEIPEFFLRETTEDRLNLVASTGSANVPAVADRSFAVANRNFSNDERTFRWQTLYRLFDRLSQPHLPRASALAEELTTETPLP